MSDTPVSREPDRERPAGPPASGAPPLDGTQPLEAAGTDGTQPLDAAGTVDATQPGDLLALEGMPVSDGVLPPAGPVTPPGVDAPTPPAASEPGPPQAAPPTAPQADPATAEHFPANAFAWVRGLGVVRSRPDRWISGTCSGLARRFDVDPLLVRAAAVVLGVLGVGFGLYLIAWAVLPDERDEILLEGSPSRSRATGVVLGIIGLIALFDAGGSRRWSVWVPVGLVALFFIWRADRGGLGSASPSESGIPAETPSAGQSHPATGSAYPTAPSAYPATGSAYASAGSAYPVGANSPGADTAAATAEPATPATAPGAYPPGTAGRYAPVVPPARHPVTVRRSSGGWPAFLLGTGAILGAGAIGWQAATAGTWSSSPTAWSVVAALGALAVVCIVKALMGMRLGPLSLWAVPLVIAGLVLALLPGVDLRGGVGSRTWRPTADGQRFELGVGEGTLDLSSLTGSSLTPPTDGYTLDTRVGVGEIAVRVPPEVTLELTATTSLGTICQPRDRCGDGDVDLHVQRTVGAGPVRVKLNAHVDLGQIVIETSGASS